MLSLVSVVVLLLCTNTYNCSYDGVLLWIDGYVRTPIISMSRIDSYLRTYGEEKHIFQLFLDMRLQKIDVREI